MFRILLRENRSDAHAEEVVKASHPGGVAACEVVVHGHDVNAQPRQGVEVHRKRCGESLPFTGAHFGNLAVV